MRALVETAVVDTAAAEEIAVVERVAETLVEAVEDTTAMCLSESSTHGPTCERLQGVLLCTATLTTAVHSMWR